MSLKLNPPFFLSDEGMVSIKLGEAVLSLGYHDKHAPYHTLHFNKEKGDDRFHWRINHPCWDAMGGGPSPKKVDCLEVGWRMFCKALGCYAIASQTELNGHGRQKYSHLMPPQCREWAVVNHHHFAALMVKLEQEAYSLIIEGYQTPERN
jgi:hypothetical protein